MPSHALDGIDALRALAHVRMDFTSDAEVTTFLDRFGYAFEREMSGRQRTEEGRNEAFFLALKDTYAHPMMGDYHGELCYGWMMQARMGAMDLRRESIMDELKKDDPFPGAPRRYEESRLRGIVVDEDCCNTPL